MGDLVEVYSNESLKKFFYKNKNGEFVLLKNRTIIDYAKKHIYT
jgi:hypothetical protein